MIVIAYIHQERFLKNSILNAKKFKGILSGLSPGTCVSNLKSMPLTILKQLAVNSGLCETHDAPFEKF